LHGASPGAGPQSRWQRPTQLAEGTWASTVAVTAFSAVLPAAAAPSHSNPNMNTAVVHIAMVAMGSPATPSALHARSAVRAIKSILLHRSGPLQFHIFTDPEGHRFLASALSALMGSVVGDHAAPHSNPSAPSCVTARLLDGVGALTSVVRPFLQRHDIQLPHVEHEPSLILLLLHDLLPDVDRVLAMHADVLVLRDVRELWQQIPTRPASAFPASAGNPRAEMHTGDVRARSSVSVHEKLFQLRFGPPLRSVAIDSAAILLRPVWAQPPLQRPPPPQSSPRDGEAVSWHWSGWEDAERLPSLIPLVGVLRVNDVPLRLRSVSPATVTMQGGSDGNGDGRPFYVDGVFAFALHALRVVGIDQLWDEVRVAHLSVFLPLSSHVDVQF
jgi:hypothetical protein